MTLLFYGNGKQIQYYITLHRHAHTPHTTSWWVWACGVSIKRRVPVVSASGGDRIVPAVGSATSRSTRSAATVQVPPALRQSGQLLPRPAPDAAGLLVLLAGFAHVDVSVAGVGGVPVRQDPAQCCVGLSCAAGAGEVCWRRAETVDTWGGPGFHDGTSATDLCAAADSPPPTYGGFYYSSQSEACKLESTTTPTATAPDVAPTHPHRTPMHSDL